MATVPTPVTRATGQSGLGSLFGNQGAQGLNNFFGDKNKMGLLGLLGGGLSGLGGQGGGLGGNLGILSMLLGQGGSANPLEGTGINPAIFGGGILDLLG